MRLSRCYLLNFWSFHNQPSEVMHHHKPVSCKNRRFSVFKVRELVRAHVLWSVGPFQSSDPFATKAYLVWWYRSLYCWECLAKTLDCCVQGEGSYLSDICLHIFSTVVVPFVTKLGMVIHHHEAECCVMHKDCFAIFKVKVRLRIH